MSINRLIKVKVSVEAKSEQVIEVATDLLKIFVRESASRGMANKRVTELLQKRFGSRSIIRLVRGQRSPSKIFSVSIHE